MTTRENLIPDDQPYGERQENREAMRNAGLPTETAGTEAPPVPQPMAPAPAQGPIDVLDGATPTRPLLDMPTAPDPQAQLRTLAVHGVNSFVKEVARRILEGT